MAVYDLEVQKKKDLDVRNRQLENGLFLADMFINKNYLINLNKSPVIPIAPSMKSSSFIRLFKIERLVFDANENTNDKLISVYSALQDLDSSAIILIDSTTEGIDFYIGIRSVKNASTAGKVLEKSLKGNFPGSIITNMKTEQLEKVLETVVKQTADFTSKTISAVTIVPSARDEDKDKFVQGIEKFIDTMMGETYTAIFISSALSKSVLEQRKRGFEELYSAISSYAKTSLQYGENYSEAVSKGISTSFADSLNRSISNSNTQSYTDTTGESTSYNSGSSYSFGGYNSSSGTTRGTSSSYSSGSSWSDSVTDGSAKTATSGETTTQSSTTGNSRSLTINHENKSVVNLLAKIDEHLKRIKNSESFGLWESAAYFVSQDVQTSVVAANTYKALVSGNDSSVENSFINMWSIAEQKNTKSILEYMKYLSHPHIDLSLLPEYGRQEVTPTNIISGNEIPFMMGLPKKSVTGLTTVEIAEFGRNVFTTNSRKSLTKTIKLGNVYHMGNVEKQEVNLELNSFTSHCFITGSTGSGKSNTSYQILEELISHGITFLVIEPAKGEYKKAFGKLSNINIFSTNPRYYRMLKINPFSFDEEIHILEHLDRMIEIFNACWPMYSAMPAILKESVELSYTRCGWDLNTSIYIPNYRSKFPTFKDLLEVLPMVIESSDYSSQAKGDYTGALVTRVKSMTNGINGQIFCSDADIDDSVLFDENSIVDLSRIGSTETKALIMGILVMKLNEYRMSNSFGVNLPLRHVTILEEAHNLLKKVSSEQSQEGANLAGKSVEMISNSIAEMRTYGEGFIIIDQSPTAVDISAIKNTNTKIVMRLPEKSDCETVGNSLALNETQIKEISKLSTGIAVVFQNNWLEPVLTKINRAKNRFNSEEMATSDKALKKLKGELAVEIHKQFKAESYSPYPLNKIIESSDVDYNKKNEYKAVIEDFIDNKVTLRKLCSEDIGNIIVSLINCRKIFDIVPLNINPENKSEMSDLTKEDIEICTAWFDKCLNILDLYSFIDDGMKKEIFSYILLSCPYNDKNLEKISIAYAVCYGMGDSDE
jgi:energy-coupling factor transporter ATP-binding protein EcfA2